MRAREQFALFIGPLAGRALEAHSDHDADSS